MARTALLLLAPLCAFTASAQIWTELGPAPISGAGDTGRISAIACHPTNPDRYYAGGADGGVWRTTDGALTWTPLTGSMPTSAIGAIAIDPSEAQTLYVGTGEANFANHSRYGLGIYKSTDGGDSWAHLAQGQFAGRCISRIIIDPTRPQRLFAAVTRAGGFPEMAAAKGHPNAAGPLGVHRSDDGGLTWSHLGGGLPDRSITDLVMDPANPDTLYAAAGHIFGDAANGVYKSPDAGATWSRLAGGLPTANVGRIALAIAPSQPNRLYALIARPADSAGNGAATLGAFRSDNSGTTWVPADPGSIQATYGWYLCVVSVRPTDAAAVVMGGLNLVRSTNSGGSYSTITPPHVDMHAIAWDAAGRLLVGDDGGVHRSTNLGSSWESRNVGLGTVQFYAGLSTHPTDDHRVFGGTQDNGSNLRSTDSLTWSRRVFGDGGWTQWDERAPQRLFAEMQGTGNIYRSSDGGGGFSYIGGGINGGDRNCFLPPFLIDPSDSQRMYYGTQRLYRSLNGGSSWTPISPDLSGGSGAIRALAMSAADPLTIYAATNDGRVLVSVNGGTTFTLRLSDAPGWPRVTREIFVDPSDASLAYLAGARFGIPHIRRTRDRGVTWETLDGDLPDVPVNVLAADSRCQPPVLYAGTDAGMYRSLDDGRTWRQYGVGLPNACIIDIRLEPARGRLIAGTQGRGAWSAPLSPRSDFNGDGFVNGLDFDLYIAAFETGEPSSDFDADGFITGLDFDAFVASFEAGC